MLDALIPVGPKDKEIAEVCALSIRKYVKDIRTIYVVCSVDPGIQGTVFINENLLSFTLDQVRSILNTTERAGWYFQQLIKLHAPVIIPDILEKYLVVDADTFFLQECQFVDNGRPIFNLGTEYHEPYFEHMSRLYPGLVKTMMYSGITHTLVYCRHWLKEMISLVEGHHEGKPFWRIYLDEVDPVNKETSGAAENELYFTYCLHVHIQDVVIKAFKWANISSIEEINYDCFYNSLHWYLRNEDLDFELLKNKVLRLN
jgi:Family of unknown function (DUF6492)